MRLALFPARAMLAPLVFLLLIAPGHTAENNPCKDCETTVEEYGDWTECTEYCEPGTMQRRQKTTWCAQGSEQISCQVETEERECICRLAKRMEFDGLDEVKGELKQMPLGEFQRQMAAVSSAGTNDAVQGNAVDAAAAASAEIGQQASACQYYMGRNLWRPASAMMLVSDHPPDTIWIAGWSGCSVDCCQQKMFEYNVEIFQHGPHANTIVYNFCDIFHIPGNTVWYYDITPYELLDIWQEWQYQHPCNAGLIANCQSCRCEGTSNRCAQCHQYVQPGVEAFWNNNGLSCEHKCSWLDNYWCWSGTCNDANGLFTSCACGDGFERVTGKASCELNRPPTISTCHSQVKHGVTPIPDGPMKSCAETGGVWLNVRPDSVLFTLHANLIVIKPPVHGMYMDAEWGEIGIIGGSVQSWHMQDINHAGNNYYNFALTSCASAPGPANAVPNLDCSHEYVLPDGIKNGLVNGDRLCLRYIPDGGGYARVNNRYSGQPSHHNYRTTTAQEERCFNMDFERPNHCRSNTLCGSCGEQPLDVQPRIKRDTAYRIVWTTFCDPEPPTNKPSRASGIQDASSFVRIFKMNPAGENLTVDVSDFHERPISGLTFFDFNVPHTEHPMMYAAEMHIRDNAGNFRITRRFFLYDSTSTLTSDPSRITVSSANPAASTTENGFWQTGGSSEVKIDLQDAFINEDYRGNNWLNRIQAAEQVEGVFDQIDGVLPVAGTPNAHGVVDFQYSYFLVSVNGNRTGDFVSVPNVVDQQVIISDLIMGDGDVLHVNIKAVDVVGHEDVKPVKINIDTSAPTVNIRGISNNGFDGLFAYSSQNWGEFVFKFDAFDEHSPLQQIEWKLGTTPGGAEVNRRVLSSHEGVDRDLCMTQENCYCPMIGKCAYIDYIITGVSGPDAHENRNYYFTVVVTNQAGLNTETIIPFVIDLTPPVPGVIHDGPSESSSRDYQSDLRLEWYCKGFKDRESDMLEYHYSISDSCLTDEEMTSKKSTLASGITQSPFFGYTAPETGHYVVTVVGYNGAMLPTSPICSSGITVDHTPPLLRSISLYMGHTQPSIACAEDNSVWMITSSGKAQPLLNTTECNRHCSETLDPVDISLFEPELKTSTNGTLIYPSEEESNHFCNLLSTYSSERLKFLTSENIALTWEYEEPESKIEEFYVGASTSPLSTEIMDLIPFTPTQARTSFRCMQCAPSEGDRFYLHIKSVNKAQRQRVVTIGPMVVDLSPPVYTSGLVMREVGDNVVLTWPATAFIDYQDPETPIHEYLLAVGTAHNQQEVDNWQQVQVPHDEITPNYNFTVEYPIENIRNHDQRHGREYIFSIRAYNRAKLFSTTSTGPYVPTTVQDFSNVQIKHVDHLGEEIGFQVFTNPASLRLQWTGLEGENHQVSIGVGTTKGLDDFVPLRQIPTPQEGAYSFDSLTLTEFTTYYFIMVVDDVTAAISNGVYVASIDNVRAHSWVSNGPRCNVASFDLLDSNIHLTNQHLVYHVNEHHISRTTNTLALTYYQQQPSPSIVVLSHNVRIQPSILEYDGPEMVTAFYQVPLYEMNQTIAISLEVPSESLLIDSIHIGTCNPDPVSQVSSITLSSRWSFRTEVSSAVTSYRLEVSELHCSTTGNCQVMDQIVPYMHTDPDVNDYLHFIEMTNGYSYQTRIIPCFGPTCLEELATSSPGILVNKDPAERGGAACSLGLNLDSGYLDQQHLSHTANVSWSTFRNVHSGMRGSSVAIYDWALQTADGRFLTGWQRLVVDQAVSSNIQLSEEVHFQLSSQTKVFLRVRGINEANLQSLLSEECHRPEEAPSRIARVYVLPNNYDADPIKEFLYSLNFRNVTEILHQDEVMFSDGNMEIDAAIQGNTCPSHDWWIQTDPSIVCDSPSASCVFKKSTNEDVVNFGGLNLEQGLEYYICAYTEGELCTNLRVCSRSFIVLNTIPNEGQVFINHSPEATILSDNSTMIIEWEGFSDALAAKILDFGEGIKEYNYAIGTSKDGGDILSWTRAGHSHHVIETGLSLTTGQLYYASVKGCGYTDLCAEVHSQPIMVDATPPVAGEVTVYTNKIYNSGKQQVIVSWTDFLDEQSGIAGYQLGVGTSPDVVDVLPFTKVSGRIMSFSGDDRLKDGQTYYFVVKCTNRAGLWSLGSSRAFLYDSSPPIAGYVRFGSMDQPLHLPFTSDLSHLPFYWGEFSDPHSSILYYRYCVGSEQPGNCDVIGWHDMGLQREYDIKMDLIPGKPYYVMVEACNSLLQCSQVVSKALIGDASPPMPGLVRLGHSDYHTTYYNTRTSASIHWFNFHDPQSDIQMYEWCIGTSPDSCSESITFTAVHKTQSVLATNLDLPLGPQLYVIIRATNNAGLQVMSASPPFIVDTSPPIELSAPAVVLDDLAVSAQYDRSVISLKWEFNDGESPISSHSISVHTHHDGDVPLDVFHLGDVKELTIPLTDSQFIDGNNYEFIISACNAAGLCKSASTGDILIDSNPPTTGHFVDDMHWENVAEVASAQMVLSWEGFYSPQPEKNKYFISVGSAYYPGDDLSNGPIEVAHDVSQEHVQRHTITINSPLVPYADVFVTLWATNGANLASETVKETLFVAVTGAGRGQLQIKQHTGNHTDCGGSCNPIGSGVIDVQAPRLSIGSSACLQASWQQIDSTVSIVRYEWTVGEQGHPTDSCHAFFTEPCWSNVDLRTSISYCIPRWKNMKLVHANSYHMHVRAYVNDSHYYESSSPAILIDTTPPSALSMSSIRFLNASLNGEIYFTTQTNQVHITWENAFEDAESGISHYFVSFGLGMDGNEVKDSVQTDGTSISFTEISLVPGLLYHATIHAVNELGMVTRMASRGLIVDLNPPLTGEVNARLAHIKSVKGDKYHLDVSWNGFEDVDSFVDFYEFAIGKSQEEIENTVNVGFRTSVDVEMDEETLAMTGDTVFAFVKATDAAGIVSSIASSNAVILDNSAPGGIECSTFESIPSDWTLQCQPCETSDCSEGYHICTSTSPIDYQEGDFVQVTLSTTENPEFVVARLELGDQSDWATFTTDTSELYIHYSTYFGKESGTFVPAVHVFDGNHSLLHLHVEKCTNILSSVSPVELKQTGPLTVNLHWSVADTESGIRSTKVLLGTSPSGSQLMSLQDVGQGSSVTLPLDVQHKTPVFATVIVENNAGLMSVFQTSPLTIDWSPPVVSDLRLTVTREGESHIVAASWKAVDDENPVNQCKWYLGSVTGSDDLLPLHPTTDLSGAESSVDLTSQAVVHATVTCTNSLHLESEPVSTYQRVPNPPSSDRAVADWHPLSATVFPPRDGKQSSRETLQFDYHGFDGTGDMDFEYSLDNKVTWTGIQDAIDYLVLDDMGSDVEGSYNFSVRARSGDMVSLPVERQALVSATAPQLTGSNGVASVNGSFITITWDGVFGWNSDNGRLLYMVYVGTGDGLANLQTGMETFDEVVTVPYYSWMQEVAVAITAVTPGGEATLYHHVIQLN